MGRKKKQKSSYLNDSKSFAEENTNSLCSSLNFSNISLKENRVSEKLAESLSEPTGHNTFPEKLIVSSAEYAGCDTYAKYLNTNFQCLIFVHPSVMRSHNIVDLAVVQGVEKQILCLVHPLDHVKKSFIVFPNECFFKDRELVSLLPYEGKVKDAEEVAVSFCNEGEVHDHNTKEFILKLLCLKYIYVGLCIQWKYFGRSYMCIIKDITPVRYIADLTLNEVSTDSSFPEFYMVNYETTIKLESETKHSKSKISAFSHIGGLEKQISSLNKYIQLLFGSKYCISSEFCGTVLLRGPSGTGKSLLLDAFSKEYNISKENYIQYTEIYSMSESEREKNLNSVFKRAINRAPSLIIIDEFNHLCPSKNRSENVHRHVSNCLSQLIAAIDDVKIMIIAATNNFDYDETVLQTSTRLMKVIDFQNPSSDERIDILQKLLARKNHELTFEHIKECAEMAHGFTAKDLLSVTEEAQLLISRSVDKNCDYDGGGIKYCDLKHIINLRKPTIVGSNIKLEKVQWSDIGGMNDVKEKLKKLVEWPLKYSKHFSHFVKTPARGILMFGPPGCSKTMLAKALATECELNFIPKNVSDLMNKYVGESEKLVRDLFSLAKSKAPCIVFLDEIDALGSERGSSSGDSGVGDRIVTTLLTEINGIEELHGVTIIAATNRPDVLDNALVRSGRISKYIYVPLPDVEAREEILKISMRNRSISDEIDFKLLSAKTEGYSGAEIVNICNEAARQLMLEVLSGKGFSEADKLSCPDSPAFEPHHFEKALKCNPPRTDKKLIECCEKFLCKGLSNIK